MYIDIHKHGKETKEDIFVLRNLFPDQVHEIDTQKYYSLGLHPWHVEKEKLDIDITKVHENASKKEIIAIGETGLDQKVNVSYIHQIEAFEQQLEIAEEFRLPVIIHCVKAYNDIITIRKRNGISLPWIIHWFNASQQIAEDLINLNCYLSFGCMLFNEKSKAFRVFPNIPEKNIFLETDDTEYSIIDVYRKASGLRQISEDKLKIILKNNFKSCFNNDNSRMAIQN